MADVVDDDDVRSRQIEYVRACQFEVWYRRTLARKVIHLVGWRALSLGIQCLIFPDHRLHQTGKSERLCLSLHDQARLSDRLATRRTFTLVEALTGGCKN